MGISLIQLIPRKKAHWLVFMYADGYVGKNNEIELCLQAYDKHHIKKFQKAIESKHKLGTKRTMLNGREFNACRIAIKDADLAMGLAKQGCINNKSFAIEMPQLNSRELYRHFIRGFLTAMDISVTEKSL